jgi:hypothetical protein
VGPESECGVVDVNQVFRSGRASWHHLIRVKPIPDSPAADFGELCLRAKEISSFVIGMNSRVGSAG